MTRRFELKTLLLSALLLSACGDDGSTPEDDGSEGDEESVDSGPAPRDASAAADARVRDASAPADGGMDADVGEPVAPEDASTPGLDASPADAAIKDAAVADAAIKPDAATSKPDAAVADAGGMPPVCSLTYDNFGKGFLNTYCVSCHDGPDNLVFTSLANVKMYKEDIKAEAVTSTNMPKGNPKPSPADRVKLGQWLDCGPN